MKTIKTDFLIIGSGFGAAAPALRLCQHGKEVLLIEKGPNIKGKEDFKQTQNPEHLSKYLKSMSGANINFTYAEGVGGGSGFYEMVSLRAPSKIFEQKSKKGTSLWPEGINRESLDPYYEIAEKMINVTQIPKEKVPKSGVAFSLLMKKLGYSCDRARYAVSKCRGSGFCISGCVFGAKQSLHYNYIPKAKENGLKLMTGLEANFIELVKQDKKYNYSINCTSSQNETIKIKTQKLILAAGTIGTAKILMRSKEHLPLISDQIGKNISFNGGVKTAGILPEGFIEGDMFSGMSHPGMISYQFLESNGITISSAKPLPVYFFATKQLKLKGQKENNYWGKDHVELMKNYRRRMIVLYALGLAPETAEIKYLGNNKFEPKLSITDSLKDYYSTTQNILHSILEKNHCQLFEYNNYDSKWKADNSIKFSTTHMTGSCRMGTDKEEGVVNPNSELFGYPDIYITDGAVIPSSLAVNTSLTILANAERVAAHLVNKY